MEAFPHNNTKYNVMCVRDNIRTAAAEAGIDENWCLLRNQSTCNYFINGKYM